MSARVIRLPVRDHAVQGKRPDCIGSPDHRRGHREGRAVGYREGFAEGRESGERYGAIIAGAFYAVMSLIVVLGLRAVGVLP